MYTNSVLMIYFWYYLTIIYWDLSKNDKYLNYLLIENKRIKLNWIVNKEKWFVLCLNTEVCLCLGLKTNNLCSLPTQFNLSVTVNLNFNPKTIQFPYEIK